MQQAQYQQMRRKRLAGTGRPVPAVRKDEPLVLLHDEADLISFRQDALQRFVTNHEYLENVTSKPIHSSKIVPPPVFPAEVKIENRKERSTEDIEAQYKALKPEEVYFGDVELMRLKAAETTDDIEEPAFGDEYTYQKEKVERLKELTLKLNDEASFAELEKEYDSIVADYKAKFNKKYHSTGQQKTFSIPLAEISADIQVQEAPANYNPRLINSFINVPNNNGHGQDVDMSQFVHQPEYQEQFMAPNYQGDRQDVVEDINQLLEGQVNDDDMGDLINFQGGDDDVLLSNAFDADFLSQIDHSME